VAEKGSKTEPLELIAAPAIEKRILVVRGRQVMLDEDLVDLYGVETKRLVEQVKRNLDRFPEDFMFPAEQGGGGSFEVADCDLKHRSRRTTLRPLRLHRAGSGDALVGSSEQEGNRRQHRDHASVRRVATRR
jgi:hypothetical protein